MRGLVAHHEAACAEAGPTVCAVVRANVDETGRDRINATLTLRASPAWLQRFKDSLGREAEAVSGRVSSARTSSEDLARQVVDTEATIRAQTALRDRLQGLLAHRAGKLSDVLKVEQELARVQGGIDATRSELAAMRGRIAASEITIAYAAAGVLAPQGAFAPLGAAASDVLGIVVAMLAGLVRLGAVLLVPGAVLAGAIWATRRWREKPAKAPLPAPAFAAFGETPNGRSQP